jgi:hypothetical protein
MYAPILTESECYICNKIDNDLIKPCNNSDCSVMAHYDCLKYNYESNEKHCICENQIATRNIIQFNKYKWLKYCFGLIYTFLMIVGGSTLNIMLALGKTINSWNMHSDQIYWTVFAVLPFCILTWQLPQIPLCTGYWRYNIFCCKNTKVLAYLTMFIMTLFLSGLIMVAHAIDHLIYNGDDFFTWRSSLVGFIVYYIVIGIMLLSSLILFIILKINSVLKINS